MMVHSAVRVRPTRYRDGGMVRIPVTSRAIRSVGYDADARVLEIEFSRGRLYQYDEVPASVYEWLLRAPNKGAYIARVIADHYPARDVTPFETPELLGPLRATLAQLRGKVD